jgi:hypothetical protein
MFERFTERAKRVVVLAQEEARMLNHNYIGTEHILLGLIREGEGVTAQVLVKLGADLNRVRQQVIQLLSGYQGKEPAGAAAGEATPSSSLVLDQFGRNYTQAAREGKLDPVIGREKEIERVMQALCRRSRNNVLLIGHPGVGKTAVVEGLAQRIARDEVPARLAKTKLYLVDLGFLAADVSSQQGFEDIVQQLLREARQGVALGEARQGLALVLCLEEIHRLLSGSTGTPVVGVAATFRAMLARGELSTVATTTPEAFRQHLAGDPVIRELFQTITIAEPTLAHTIEILKGLCDRYEAHHRVSITDAALVAAATLANQHISDRFLPAKAIDLIDDAAARLAVQPAAYLPDLQELDNRIRQVRRDKEAAIDAKDFEEAGRLRDLEKALLADKFRRESELRSWLDSSVTEVDADWVSVTVEASVGAPREDPGATDQARATPVALRVARLPKPDRSSAILIGSASYADPDLANIPAVANNVADLALAIDRTRHGGFDPTRIHRFDNPGWPDVGTIAAIAEDTTDTLLVYFAGHGVVEADGELYLCLASSQRSRAMYTALSYDKVRRLFLDSPAVNGVVILDCCYSGRAIEWLSEDTAPSGQLDVAGTYVLTATSATRPAHVPNGGKNSTFTGALLAILHSGTDGGDELLRLTEIYPRLRSRLVAAGFPAPRQRGTDAIGNLALTRNPAWQPAPTTEEPHDTPDAANAG